MTNRHKEKEDKKRTQYRQKSRKQKIFQPTYPKKPNLSKCTVFSWPKSKEQHFQSYINLIILWNYPKLK